MTPAVESPVNGFISKTHISLNVSDVARSVAFYEAFFGVPAHKRRPGYANFDLATPALKLALNEAEPGTMGRSRLDHLGIVVGTKAEVDATRARLESSGLVSFDEGDTVCCYARQDKVWVTDPDGNSWEVYVLLDDMADEDDHEEHQGKMPLGLPLAMAECCGGSQPAGQGDCCT